MHTWRVPRIWVWKFIRNAGFKVTPAITRDVLAAIGNKNGTIFSLMDATQEELARRALNQNFRWGGRTPAERWPDIAIEGLRLETSDLEILELWDHSFFLMSSTRFQKPDPRYLTREGQRAAFPDSIDPTVKMFLPWGVAVELKRTGELPLVSEQTIARLRNDLRSMSVAPTVCTLCGEALADAEYERMARRIVTRRLKPPSLGHNGTIPFPSRHEICARIYAAVSAELLGFAGSHAKLKRCMRAILVADGGRILAELLEMPEVEGVAELTELINLIIDNSIDNGGGS
jgi:hypothetical protein